MAKGFTAGMGLVLCQLSLAHAQSVPDIRGETATRAIDRNQLPQTNSPAKSGLNTEQAANSLRDKETALLANPSPQTLIMLREKIAANPNNLDYYFYFAQAALALEQYDRAESAYQSMLAMAPDLGRVRLDLAALHLQRNQFEAAQREMERVLKQNPPEQVEQNIRNILAQIEDAQREHQFSGNVSFGVNADSNGNSAPRSGSIFLFDTEIPLGDQQRRQSDIQGFTALSGEHLYRPSWGRGREVSARWRNSASLYRAEQSSLEVLDLQALTLRTGPEFELEDYQFTIAPTFEHSHITLDGQTYLRTYTGELNLEKQFSPRLSVGTRIRHGRNDFANAENISVYELRTGSTTQLSLYANYLLSERDFLNAEISLRRDRTREEFFDNDQFGASLGYTRFLSPDWFTTGIVGYRNMVYDGADLLLSSRRRHDSEYLGGITLGYRIDPYWTATLGYQYRDTQSNLLNYDYNNHRVAMALSRRF